MRGLQTAHPRAQRHQAIFELSVDGAIVPCAARASSSGQLRIAGRQGKGHMNFVRRPAVPRPIGRRLKHSVVSIGSGNGNVGRPFVPAVQRCGYGRVQNKYEVLAADMKVKPPHRRCSNGMIPMDRERDVWSVRIPFKARRAVIKAMTLWFHWRTAGER